MTKLYLKNLASLKSKIIPALEFHPESNLSNRQIIIVDKPNTQLPYTSFAHVHRGMSQQHIIIGLLYHQFYVWTTPETLR